MSTRFSDRHGYRLTPPEITVYEDAPSELRDAIPLIAQVLGMQPSKMREAICQVLLVRPDRYNWFEYPNIWEEVGGLMTDAEWYKVYDIAEALYSKTAEILPFSPDNAKQFERSLNDVFVENGIGWEMRDGKINLRGSAAFQKSAHEVPEQLNDSGLSRASSELQEALRDISRRPNPDVTGAMQHAMAALESTAREITGQPKPTLGKLISKLNLPAPVDAAIHKLWGYASDRGRHVREGQAVDRAEAEFIVTVVGALCAYLIRR